MLARCSASLANRLPPGRFAFVTAWGVPCSRESAAWLASDISALLLPQKYMRGSEETDREERKDDGIKPEIGIGQSFGKGADADRLEPSRWKHQPDRPSAAGKRGYRHEQTGKVHDGDDGENRGCKDCRYLSAGEGRDELSESARRDDVDQSPQRKRSKGSFDRHVENDIRHQHHEDECQHPDGDIGKELAHQKFEFADGRGPKIGDRAGFLLAHDTDGRHDRWDQNQYYDNDARNHGEDALETLVVMEAIFDVDATEVDIG